MRSQLWKLFYKTKTLAVLDWISIFFLRYQNIIHVRFFLELLFSLLDGFFCDVLQILTETYLFFLPLIWGIFIFLPKNYVSSFISVSKNTQKDLLFFLLDSLHPTSHTKAPKYPPQSRGTYPSCNTSETGSCWTGI